MNHLQYDEAGHSFGLPYRPTALGRGRPSPHGSGLDFGGTPAENAHAGLDAWRAMLEFLEESLGGS